MRLVIGAVGRLKAGPERELFDRYIGRARTLARGVGFAGPELIECEDSKARSTAERRRDETVALLSRSGAGDRVVMFDEAGHTFASQGFASLLTAARADGAAALLFCVGGADGLAPDLRSRASHVLAFGSATLPHQIVRILVAEQVYRAMTIMAQHPYHRG